MKGLRIRVDEQAELVHVEPLDGRGRVIEPADGGAFCLTSGDPLLVRLELEPTHPPVAKLVFERRGYTVLRAHAGDEFEADPVWISVDPAAQPRVIVIDAPGDGLADKHVFAENHMADGSVVTVYASARVGDIDLTPEQIVLNGRVVPDDEIRRGWVDADEYA